LGGDWQAAESIRCLTSLARTHEPWLLQRLLVYAINPEVDFRA
jgi:hypothetical protein